MGTPAVRSISLAIAISCAWFHFLVCVLHSFPAGHRRTASLPSGPLLSPIGQNHPSRATLLSVPSPVYPSLSQFSRAVDGADISTPDGDTSENQGTISFKVTLSRLGSQNPKTWSIFLAFHFQRWLTGPAVIPPLSENGFRLLSWNLDALSVEKARNPGVIDVVSKILSRYNISVAVFQGISDPLALQLVWKKNRQHNAHWFMLVLRLCSCVRKSTNKSTTAHLPLTVVPQQTRMSATCTG